MNQMLLIQEDKFSISRELESKLILILPFFKKETTLFIKKMNRQYEEIKYNEEARSSPKDQQVHLDISTRLTFPYLDINQQNYTNLEPIHK